MTYTTLPLSPPVRIKRDRGRPYTLAYGVFDKGSTVVAVFRVESSARAYCARLNQLAGQRRAMATEPAG